MSNPPNQSHPSSRGTGNDPIEGVDPGGTRSTKPGQADKSAPKAGEGTTQQVVESGDRNSMDNSNQIDNGSARKT